MNHFLIATIFVTMAGIDTWDLKFPYQPKESDSWDVRVTLAELGIGANMQAELSVDVKDEKGISCKYSYKNIEVDGGAATAEDETNSALLSLRGEILSVNAEPRTDMRRMASVFFFVYPENPIKVGDSWEVETKFEDKEVRSIKRSYKVIAIEKVENINVMKIFTSFAETGNSPMSGDGHFWMTKEGYIHKIELNVKAWPVPMANQQLDVTLSAARKKSKSI